MKSETLGTPLFILKTNQKYLLFCTFILDCFFAYFNCYLNCSFTQSLPNSLFHTSRILVKQVESGNWPTVPVDRYLIILLDRIVHLQSESRGVTKVKKYSLLYWNFVHTLSCEQVFGAVAGDGDEISGFCLFYRISRFYLVSLSFSFVFLLFVDNNWKTHHRKGTTIWGAEKRDEHLSQLLPQILHKHLCTRTVQKAHGPCTLTAPAKEAQNLRWTVTTRHEAMTTTQMTNTKTSTQGPCESSMFRERGM